MMKPDLKIAIAWGSNNHAKLAVELHKKLSHMRESGYPVESLMIAEDGDGRTLQKRVLDLFSNCDLIVFLFDISHIDVRIEESLNITIDHNIDHYLLQNLYRLSKSFMISQNMIYELGISQATHMEENNILWFSNGAVHKSFPSDIETPIITNLAIYNSIDDKIDAILKQIHLRVLSVFSYLNSNYYEPVVDPLKNINYRPNLQNLISHDYLHSMDYLSTIISPLDEYFYKEYSRFSKNHNKYDLSRRIQFLIDRAILFVYLRNNTRWSQIISELSNDYLAMSDNHTDGVTEYHKNAIELLHQVMLYHKMMENTVFREGNNNDDYLPTSILKKLEELEKRCCFTNSMVMNLQDDYLGLTYHKVALESIAQQLQLNSFRATDKSHIENLGQNDSDKSYILLLLYRAIAHFDKVITRTNEYSLENNYTWLSYVLYNKARCEYLLNIINSNFGVNWAKDMEEAIFNRKIQAEKYNAIITFPVIISHSMYAEYFHAKLELLFYLYNNDSSNIEQVEIDKIIKDIKVWSSESTLYTDVLNVLSKLDSLKTCILQ